MMISPEAFYKEQLAGKNAAQLLRFIRRTKRRINTLKRIMERPDYKPTVCPSEDVVLSVERKYLERAKAALLEAGGDYIPTAAEKRVAEFDAGIPYICRIELDIGGFFEGYEKRICCIEEERVRFACEGHSVASMPCASEEHEDPDKESFLEELTDLHIGEWRRKYDLSPYGLIGTDGVQWHLCICYSDGRRPARFCGDNAYPHNFKRLKELLGICSFEEDENGED